MTNITINVPDERLKQLKERAEHSGMTTEELVLLSIEELLTQPDDDFKNAIKYVLTKNADLYRRLA